MTTSALTPAPRRHAYVLRYSAWQFRDYAINIGILSVILFGLLGMLEVMQLRMATRTLELNPRLVSQLGRMRQESFQHLFTMYASVGPILALSGMVSQDRSMGYVRFLFAKPLNPLRFYLQSFVVRTIGYFVVAALLVACYRAFEPTADLGRVAAGLGLFFIAFGGMTFLGSVISKYDGLGTVAFLLISVVVWAQWEISTTIWHALTYLVPPIEKFSGVSDWVSNLNPLNPGQPVVFPTKWVIWTVSYGVACLVLGVVLLRKRPLARA
ncbi:MAG TPA: hypothetical protein VGM67_07930 [Gemmatimonadaceae bacterium]|jgi:hypothetical protein